jgi:hypothetical protein
VRDGTIVSDSRRRAKHDHAWLLTARGNSGVYLQGRCEIQLLDSVNNPIYPRRSNAALYGFPPLVNASRRPGSGKRTTSSSMRRNAPHRGHSPNREGLHG